MFLGPLSTGSSPLVWHRDVPKGHTDTGVAQAGHLDHQQADLSEHDDDGAYLLEMGGTGCGTGVDTFALVGSCTAPWPTLPQEPQDAVICQHAEDSQLNMTPLAVDPSSAFVGDAPSMSADRWSGAVAEGYMIEAAKYDDMVDTQSPCPYASIYKECCEQSMDPAWKLPEGERASGNGSKHRFRAKMAIRPKKANPTDGKEDKGEEEEEEEEGGEEGQEQQQQQQHRQQKNTKMKYVSLQVWGLPYELPPKSFSDPFLGVGLSAWLVSTRQLINQDRKVPKDTPFTGSDRFDIISLYENLLTMVYLKREASEPVLQKVCLEALSDCYNLHPAIPSAVIRYATWMSRNGDKLEKLPNGKLGRKELPRLLKEEEAVKQAAQQAALQAAQPPVHDWAEAGWSGCVRRVGWGEATPHTPGGVGDETEQLNRHKRAHVDCGPGAAYPTSHVVTSGEAHALLKNSGLHNTSLPDQDVNRSHMPTSPMWPTHDSTAEEYRQRPIKAALGMLYSLAMDIPEALHTEFLDRITAECEWAQKAQDTAFGSFLAYLEMDEMADGEKKTRLKMLFAAAQTVAKQLGLPPPSPPTLQIGDSLYSLSASGDLEKRQCKQPPRILSAHVLASSRGASSRPFKRGAQHPLGRRLVILAADALAGDQMRLHFENDKRTITVIAEVDDTAVGGQGVPLSISVPPDAKRIVAVELLRDSFASQPMEVSWPALPSGNKEPATCKDLSDASNHTNVSTIPASSKTAGSSDLTELHNNGLAAAPGVLTLCAEEGPPGSLVSMEGSTGCQDTDVPPQSTAARLISDKPRASSETTFSTDTGAIQSSPDLDVLLPEEAQAEGDSAAQLTTAVPPAVEPIVVEVVRGSFASQQIGFTQQMVHRPVRLVQAPSNDAQQVLSESVSGMSDSGLGRRGRGQLLPRDRHLLETIVPVQNEDAQEGRDESGDSLLDTATGAMLVFLKGAKHPSKNDADVGNPLSSAEQHWPQDQFSRMFARERGQTDMVKLPMSGAYVTATDSQGMTALIRACQSGSVDAREQQIRQVEVVGQLLAAGADVNAQDHQGDTALIHAGCWAHDEVVGKLLAAGAIVDAPGPQGNTALLRICMRRKNGTDVRLSKVAQLLLGAQANPSVATQQGETALMCASDRGYVEIVGQLLAAGAVVDSQDDRGMTALMYASGAGCTEVVRQLLAAQVTVATQDHSGNTALMYASNSGCVELVGQLLAAGAGVDTQDFQGRTALMCACNLGHVKVAGQLLAAGALVDTKDHQSNTALWYGSKAGHEEVVRKLVAAGADVDTPDHQGNTILLRLCKLRYVGMDQYKVAKLLLEAHANPSVTDAEASGLQPLA
ncbi:hypothetical protein ABBQ38_013001 [Trebouxia sp. C0009 RCD-2024]